MADDIYDALDAVSGPAGDQARTDFANAPLATETPADTSSRLYQADTQRRQWGRAKASDLANRGIPSFTDTTGDTRPIADPTGAALTSADPRNSIAYDSSGNAVSYAQKDPNTGQPVLGDPYASAPRTTDKEGNIYSAPKGLPWRFEGLDPAVVQANQDAQAEKLNQQANSALGPYESQAKTQASQSDRAAKASAKLTAATLQKTGVPLTDDTGELLFDLHDRGLDAPSLKAHIDQTFNKEYASDAANERPWFGNGQYSPAAQTLRQNIDQRKAQANAAVNAHAATLGNAQAANDQLSQIQQTRQQLEAQKLAAVNARRQQSGMAPVSIPGLEHVAPSNSDQGAGGTPNAAGNADTSTQGAIPGIGGAQGEITPEEAQVHQQVAAALPPSAQHAVNIPPTDDNGNAKPESFWGTAGRAFASKIIPSIATAAGGLTAGAAAIESGPGAIAADIAAGAASGYATNKAQRAVMGDAWANQNDAQMEANAKEHPIAAQIGSTVPFLVSLLGGQGWGALAKGITGAGKAAVKEALQLGEKATLPWFERSLQYATLGARGGASEGVQQKDATPGSVLDATAKTAITNGALGLFPMAKTLISAAGLGKVVGDAGAMALAGGIYDSAIHGKPFDAEEIAKEAGGNIPAFLIQHALLTFLHTGMGSVGPMKSRGGIPGVDSSVSSNIPGGPKAGPEGNKPVIDVQSEVVKPEASTKGATAAPTEEVPNPSDPYPKIGKRDSNGLLSADDQERVASWAARQRSYGADLATHGKDAADRNFQQDLQERQQKEAKTAPIDDPSKEFLGQWPTRPKPTEQFPRDRNGNLDPRDARIQEAWGQEQRGELQKLREVTAQRQKSVQSLPEGRDSTSAKSEENGLDATQQKITANEEALNSDLESPTQETPKAEGALQPETQGKPTAVEFKEPPPAETKEPTDFDKLINIEKLTPDEATTQGISEADHKTASEQAASEGKQVPAESILKYGIKPALPPAIPGVPAPSIPSQPGQTNEPKKPDEPTATTQEQPPGTESPPSTSGEKPSGTGDRGVDEGQRPETPTGEFSEKEIRDEVRGRTRKLRASDESHPDHDLMEVGEAKAIADTSGFSAGRKDDRMIVNYHPGAVAHSASIVAKNWMDRNLPDKDAKKQAKRWVRAAHDEELIHIHQLVTAGKGHEAFYAKIWREQIPQPMREAYDHARNWKGERPESDADKAAEFERMVIQYRNTGTISEALFGSEAAEKRFEELKPFLGRQIPQIEANIARVTAKSAGPSEEASQESTPPETTPKSETPSTQQERGPPEKKVLSKREQAAAKLKAKLGGNELAASKPEEFKEDAREQAQWMQMEARARGFDTPTELAQNDTQEFKKLGVQWRSFHERDTEGSFLQNAGIQAINEALYGRSKATIPDLETSHAGGRLAGTRDALRDALAIAGGSERAGGSAGKAPDRWKQGEALEKWARENGLLLEKLPPQFDPESQDNKGGLEHDVFFLPAAHRWLKVTRDAGVSMGRQPAPAFEGFEFREATPLEYLQRLKDWNETMGDDIRLHGFLFDGKSIDAIISQPNIVGDDLTADEIDQGFESAGYRKFQSGGYYRKRGNTAVFDVHRANAVRRYEMVIPFDGMAIHPNDELKDAIDDLIFSQSVRDTRQSPQERKIALHASKPVASDAFYAEMAEDVRDDDSKQKATKPEEEQLTAIVDAYREEQKQSDFPGIRISDVMERAGYAAPTMQLGKQHLMWMWNNGMIRDFPTLDWSLVDDRTRAWAVHYQADSGTGPGTALAMILPKSIPGIALHASKPSEERPIVPWQEFDENDKPKSITQFYEGLSRHEQDVYYAARLDANDAGELEGFAHLFDNEEKVKEIASLVGNFDKDEPGSWPSQKDGERYSEIQSALDYDDQTAMLDLVGDDKTPNPEETHSPDREDFEDDADGEKEYAHAINGYRESKTAIKEGVEKAKESLKSESARLKASAKIQAKESDRRLLEYLKEAKAQWKAIKSRYKGFSDDDMDILADLSDEANEKTEKGLHASKPDDGKAGSSPLPLENLVREAEESGVTLKIDELKGLTRGDPAVMTAVRAKIKARTGRDALFASKPIAERLDELKDASGWNSLVTATQKVFSPDSVQTDEERKLFRGDPNAIGGARHTSMDLDKVTAEMDRRKKQWEDTLKHARDLVSRLSDPLKLELMKRVDEGTPLKEGPYKAAIDQLAAIDAQRTQELKDWFTAMGRDDWQNYENFLKNIVPHYFKDQAIAAKVTEQYIDQRKKMAGSSGFLKHREGFTMREIMDWAETQGIKLEPKHTNVIDAVMDRWTQQERYRGAHTLMEAMAEDGRGHWENTDYIPRGNNVKISNLVGRRHVDGRWQDFYADAPSAQIINNYLSRGLRGMKFVENYFIAANALNALQLGVSFFHAGFVTTEGMVSSFALGLQKLFSGDMSGLKEILKAPFSTGSDIMLGRKIRKEMLHPGSMSPDMTAVVDAMVAGGYRDGVDSFYHDQHIKAFFDAIHGHKVFTGVLRAPLALIELIAKPIMEYYVPWMKGAAVYKLAQMHLKQSPGITATELHRRLQEDVRSGNSRFGQLTYDNLHLHKTVKDILMGMTRSLGWNFGSLAELGGGVYEWVKFAKNAAIWGARRIGGGGKGGGGSGGEGGLGDEYQPGGKNFPRITNRMAYVLALPIIIGIFGAVLAAMFGQRPKQLKDYYAIKTGEIDDHGNPVRVQLPSYVRDMVSYSKHPLQTLSNKLHPLLAMLSQMLQNRDFFNVEIRHEGDPVMKQILEEIGYVGKQLAPFSVRNAQKLTGSHASIPIRVAAAVGALQIAPSSAGYTAAQEKANDLMREQIPTKSRTQEAADHSALVSQLTGLQRIGKGSQAISAALAAGKITTKDVEKTQKNASVSQLVATVNHLSLSDAKKVESVANPEERLHLRPVIAKKSEKSGKLIYANF